jgi:hypothetical protein
VTGDGAPPLTGTVTLAELSRLATDLTDPVNGDGSEVYDNGINLLLARVAYRDDPVAVTVLVAIARDMRLIRGAEYARGVIDLLAEAGGWRVEEDRLLVEDLVFGEVHGG